MRCTMGLVDISHTPRGNPWPHWNFKISAMIGCIKLESCSGEQDTCNGILFSVGILVYVIWNEHRPLFIFNENTAFVWIKDSTGFLCPCNYGNSWDFLDCLKQPSNLPSAQPLDPEVKSSKQLSDFPSMCNFREDCKQFFFNRQQSFTRLMKVVTVTRLYKEFILTWWMLSLSRIYKTASSIYNIW